MLAALHCECCAGGALLDAGRDGVADGLMIANGVTVEQMVALVRTGLATGTAQRIRAGGKAMEVATLRITEAGRKALAEAQNENSKKHA